MRWESNSLAHHGIKGQQWGVRHFQNEDGTLTKAGKERYYKHLDREDNLDNRQLNNAPNELAYHNSHKKELVERIKKTGYDDANANAWYEARKKALEDQVKYAPRDKAFNQEMRKFLNDNDNITVQDLKDQINESAKKTGLDVDWVKKYYDQNLNDILGIEDDITQEKNFFLRTKDLSMDLKMKYDTISDRFMDDTTSYPKLYRDNIDAYNQIKPKIVNDFIKQSQSDPAIQQIEKEKDQLVKDYYKNKKLTELTIFDILFRRKEAEEKRYKALKTIMDKYRSLDTDKELCSYAVVDKLFNKLPQNLRLIAMSSFKPYEKPWSDAFKPNAIYKYLYR